MCPITVNVVVGYIEGQFARLYEVWTSTMHSGRLVVAFMAMPKPLEPMALQNPSGFVAWLDLDNKPVEPLDVREFIHSLALLNKEPYEWEGASGSNCGVQSRGSSHRGANQEGLQVRNSV